MALSEERKREIEEEQRIRERVKRERMMKALPWLILGTLLLVAIAGIPGGMYQ